MKQFLQVMGAIFIAILTLGVVGLMLPGSTRVVSEMFAQASAALQPSTARITTFPAIEVFGLHDRRLEEYVHVPTMATVEVIANRELRAEVPQVAVFRDGSRYGLDYDVNSWLSGSWGEVEVISTELTTDQHGRIVLVIFYKNLPSKPLP